jgi:hypothetical protein
MMRPATPPRLPAMAIMQTRVGSPTKLRTRLSDIH